MKIHEIKGKISKDRKRVGRGLGSGKGKTAGRGTKGQKARTGHHYVPAAFEGGQMPIHMRLPKLRGFKRLPRVGKLSIRVSALNHFEDGTEITSEYLLSAGFIARKGTKIKVVDGGQLTKKLTVKLPATATATAAIQKAGGSVEPAPVKARSAKAKPVKADSAS